MIRDKITNACQNIMEQVYFSASVYFIKVLGTTATEIRFEPK